jgi:Spy/CpxP family protein refolding chaperone
MKHFLLATLLFASTTVMAEAPAMTNAQPGGPGAQPAGAPVQPGPGVTLSRPMMTPPGGGIAKALDLSPEQEKALEAAQIENQKAMAPLQQERAKLVQELTELVKDEKSGDADLKAKINALKANKKALLAQQDKYIDKLATILNTRQMAKLTVMLDNQGMRRSPMGGVNLQHPQGGPGAPAGVPGGRPAPMGEPLPAPNK